MVSTQLQELSALQIRIINAISEGSADTRADLARYLDLAPSTVSVRVQELLDQELISESGEASSTGGRRATVLSLKRDEGYFLVAELGGFHARIGISGLDGNLLHVKELPLELTPDPKEVLKTLVDYLSAFQNETQVNGEAKGICLGVPGPVDVQSGRVEHPSRMPGWNQYPVAEALQSLLPIPVMVENDANLMAYGEHVAHPGIKDSITVKAGTGIGGGLVVDGQLYHGGTGIAGDLSHARLPEAEPIPCACGNTGCLEALASGAAIVRQLCDEGYQISSVGEVVDLVTDADALSTNLVRNAGKSLGAMLCPIVGFVNPDAVFLGGQLSSLEVFVASVRGQLYDGCHPLVTKKLLIEPAKTSSDASLIGAAALLAKELQIVG